MKARATFAALLALLQTPAVLAEEKPAGKVQLATVGGQLVISINKWVRADRGENTGLIVWYEWEGQERGRGEVTKGSTDWSVRFPTRPEVGKTGTIEYTFVFAMNKTNERQLEDATADFKAKSAVYVSNVAQGYADWLRAESAAKTAPEDAAKQEDKTAKAAALDALHAKEFPAVLTSLAPLKDFTDDSGTPARDVLLEAAGFEKVEGKDTWRINRAAAAFASATAAEDTAKSQATKAVAEALTALKSTDACSTAAKAEPRTVESDVATYTACRSILATKLANDAQKSALAELTTAIDAFKSSPSEATLAEVKEKRKGLGKALSASTPPVDEEAESGIKVAVNDLELRLVTEVQHQKRLDALKAKVDQVRVTLKSSQRAEEILKLEGTRRNFDIASGITYVAELDEWVVPIFVSWCPWGCQRPDAGFDAPKHHFSLDLGLRTAMVDKGRQIDPRHDHGTVSPMLGASWNPASFVRGSAGAYYFMNAQTDDWNVRPYVGVTLDLVRLAEVTQLVGLGEPPKPKLEQKP